MSDGVKTTWMAQSPGPTTLAFDCRCTDVVTAIIITPKADMFGAYLYEGKCDRCGHEIKHRTDELPYE